MNTKSKTIMVQGTASGVGKSFLATALCRILYQDGYKVAPFKAINISLNSGVTSDGEEMATSQIVQAQASGIEAEALMNPFLIKPQYNHAPQVIIKGKLANLQQVKKYYASRDGLWSIVKQSFENLASRHNVIVLEGAASPAEPSFILDDIVNLKMAKYAKAPIILVGDIDKGGVFASLEGTISILRRHDPEAAKLIQGFVINKYQGEKKYLDLACKELTGITGIPVLGIIPFISNHGISDEDSWFLEDKRTKKENPLLDIVIIRSPFIQNFHDFDPFFEEPNIQVRFISKAKDFGNPDLVILAGTKNTITDLIWIKSVGLGELIVQHANRGKGLIGICGGFQMLGKSILDPLNVESVDTQTKGLGLLPFVTTFKSKKITKQVKTRITHNKGLLEGAYGMEVSGYEIHMGRTESNGKVVAGVFCLEDGFIIGTYLHDIFRNNNFKNLILQNIARKKGVILPVRNESCAKDNYDNLASIVQKNLDMKLFYQILNKER